MAPALDNANANADADTDLNKDTDSWTMSSYYTIKIPYKYSFYTMQFNVGL